jgi:hypothetical protein
MATAAGPTDERRAWRGARSLLRSAYRFLAAFFVAVFFTAVFFTAVLVAFFGAAFLAAFFAILPPWLAVLNPGAVIDASLQVD